MKRFIDILLSGIGLTVLLPILGLVAVGIKLSSTGPVFFRQERMGRHGGTFKIFKFRTMNVQNNDNGIQVTAGGDSRITPLGKILRKYKLDELPQLLNVLKGDMALVGPRPEVPEFASLFPSHYRKILRVRPGITHPITLRFRREEEILASSTTPREFYIHKILPEKLAAYETNLEQNCFQDLFTILQTVFPLGNLELYGPEHFSPMVGGNIIPFPTTSVQNIPAFSGSVEDGVEAAELNANSPSQIILP